MAGVDYAKILEIATRLITENGREVTVIQYDDTPADTNLPWEGVAPRTTPKNSTKVTCVFVPPSGLAELGLRVEDNDLLKRAEEIMIAPANGSFDLAVAHEVIDGGVRKKIEFTETLRPATTTLMYFIGVNL